MAKLEFKNDGPYIRSAEELRALSDIAKVDKATRALSASTCLLSEMDIAAQHEATQGASSYPLPGKSLYLDNVHTSLILINYVDKSLLAQSLGLYVHVNEKWDFYGNAYETVWLPVQVHLVWGADGIDGYEHFQSVFARVTRTLVASKQNK